jgi:hypothetical protein
MLFVREQSADDQRAVPGFRVADHYNGHSGDRGRRIERLRISAISSAAANLIRAFSLDLSHLKDIIQELSSNRWR